MAFTSPPRDLASTQTRKSHSPHRQYGHMSPFAVPPSNDAQPSTTAPMSVPRSNIRKSPPPPLPPPRFLGSFHNDAQELVHRPLEGDNVSAGSGSVRSGSSLLGGSSGCAKQYTGPQKKVDMSMGSPKPGGSSEGELDKKVLDLGAVAEYNNLQGEKQLNQKSNERSSAAYDKQVLASLSSGQPAEDPASPKSFRDFGSSLRPLSVSSPRRRRSDAAESSPRWPPSALSPSFHNVQSPLSDSDAERRAWSRPPNSSHSNNPSEPQPQLSSPHRNQQPTTSMEHDAALGDDSHLSELNSNDKRLLYTEIASVAQKRRAQSPHQTTIDPSLEDGLRQTNPQVARLQHQEPPSLASSASSNMQSGSYQSSHGFSAGSSATSYSSQRPESSHPQLQQQQQQQQQDLNGSTKTPQDAPNGTSVPSTPQQQQQMGPPPLHRRMGSSGVARPPGVFICECCPKKPKKFESEDELRAHEMEKQYFCHFCHNRFKNKNEAERHQNSLHLRRHSWSCAALQSLEDAFHSTAQSAMGTTPGTPQPPSAQPPQGSIFPKGSDTDTCGYCGAEFANPPDWNARVEHLNHVHKFGECNQSKKFFRADHFRQHLKHSHSGTSGRWTNMLENACMRDEPPPQLPSQMPMGISGPLPVGQLHAIPAGMQYSGQMPPGPIPQGPVPPQAQMQQAQMQQMQQVQPSMTQTLTPQQPQQMQPPQPQMQQPPQPIPPGIQTIPSGTSGIPMTQQQAQQAAQQATEQANEQQQQSNDGVSEDIPRLPTATDADGQPDLPQEEDVKQQ